MKIICGLNKITRFSRPVLAIGIFDGVHRGHAGVLKECAATAAKTGGTSAVLTFSPHPQKEESIYSLEHRLAIIGKFGIRVCFIASFTRALAQMSAADFIRQVISRRIGAKYVLVGENFSFGRGLEGNVSTLRRYAPFYGYKLKVFPTLRFKGGPLSSTRIRERIRRGRLAEAQAMLGRRVSVFGRVVSGRGIGGKLGYPTANIEPQHEVLPPSGVYAVKALVRGKEFPAACYIGRRPTFGRGRVVIEAHLSGFPGNLYRSLIEVRFFQKIRAERKFPSCAALCSAIKKDITAAKKVISAS